MSLVELLQTLNLGCGAACLAVLIQQRIPQRVARIEKHLKLKPLAEDTPK